MAIDNDEKIFDRDSGGVINSTNPCINLREDYGTSTEEVTLSDFIVTLKKFHYSVLNDLGYVYSFSCSENTVGIRWAVLEKLQKPRINITYNEFLCLKTGEFSAILKELITGNHGDKLLEVDYVEKLKFLSNLHAQIKDGVVCQHVRLKHSFADFYYVTVVIAYGYGENEKNTVTVSCNKKEYAKMKLLM